MKNALRFFFPACVLAVALIPAVLATPSAQAQSYTILYSFAGGSDGAHPEAGLILDTAGNLYGTTPLGGGTGCRGIGCGTVFKLDTTGTETLLYRFKTGADGAYPSAGLVRDTAGNLYGTTEYGGNLNCNAPVGCGTVFEVSRTGKKILLYSLLERQTGRLPTQAWSAMRPAIFTVRRHSAALPATYATTTVVEQYSK